MIILIDQDGPLADFEKGFLQSWKSKFPDEFFVEIEARRSFKIKDDYPEQLRPQVEQTYLEKHFYETLPIVQGASEAIHVMLERGHDVRICTSPLSQYENCILEKYFWVERHLGRDFLKRMIVTKDKTLIRGDLLIDDNPDVWGAVEPAWRWLLYDAPYNRGVLNRPRLTWATWMNLFEELRLPL